MGREPVTLCSECGDAFDVYHPPEDRVCDSCKEDAASDNEKSEASP